MPTKLLAKLTSWSFSRWSVYVQCPAKARYKFIDKLPEPGNAAMERGNTIHKLAEAYVKGDLKMVPKELALFKSEMRELKKAGAHAEQSLTFTKDWKGCAWNDWNNAWLRIKIDTLAFNGDAANVIDYKTGKARDDYELQLSLYDLGTLLAYPELKIVSSALWFLDHGEIRPVIPRQATQKDVPLLKKEWLSRVKPMLSDTKFSPTPGDYCRYCAYAKGKGGPCRY